MDHLEVADPQRVCYLTQTTLSLDETRDIVARLMQRFPSIQAPPAQDICYATENRAAGGKGRRPAIDLLLVVGSENSSNSRRLVEVGGNTDAPARLVNDPTEIDPAWLDGIRGWRHGRRIGAGGPG